MSSTTSRLCTCIRPISVSGVVSEPRYHGAPTLSHSLSSHNLGTQCMPEARLTTGSRAYFKQAHVGTVRDIRKVCQTIFVRGEYVQSERIHLCSVIRPDAVELRHVRILSASTKSM